MSADTAEYSPEQNTIFETARCRCRTLMRKDVDARCSWEPYPEALLSFYYLPIKDPERRERLYARWMAMNREWYAIEVKETNALAAVLSLREIKAFRRSARLGIVVDSALVGQGWGTEILNGFLEYYFAERQFNKMVLDVARFNERARKCYEKCGFKVVGEFWREYPGSPLIQKNPEFKQYARYFKIKRGSLYAVYDDMELNRAQWEDLRSGSAV